MTLISLDSKVHISVLGTRGIPDIQGGVEKHCQELYSRMSSHKRISITVYARSPYFIREQRLPVFKNIFLRYIWCPRNKNLETIIHTFISCLICIYRKVNIVHFHNIGPALFIPIVKAFGIKTVLTYHSINYLHSKWGRIGRFVLKIGERQGIMCADRVIVVSKSTKEYLETKYNIKKLQYIPNGISVSSRVPAGETLRKYGVEPKKYIFTACRFVPEKGLHNLINAFICTRQEGVKLIIAGGADYETDYSRLIRRKAEESVDIILTGSIKGSILAELFSNTGLFILPSFHEGMPIALLEALSYEVPVLVSDIPQNREIPLQNFRYFHPGNEEDLAEKIVQLLKIGIDDEEKMHYRKIIENTYNWDKIAKQTYQVYDSLFFE